MHMHLLSLPVPALCDLLQVRGKLWFDYTKSEGIQSSVVPNAVSSAAAASEFKCGGKNASMQLLHVKSTIQ